MRLFRTPIRKLGRPGTAFKNVATAGTLPAPPTNDHLSLDNRAECEFIMVLEMPLPASGTTFVNDLGGYALVGPANGVHLQDYHILAMPIEGSDVSEDNTITNTIGGTPPDTEKPVMVPPISVTALTSTSYTMSIPAATDNVGVTAYRYSIDGGLNWTDNGTSRTANISGRTPGSVDPLRWSARDLAGNWADPLAGIAELQALENPVFIVQPQSQSLSDGATLTLTWDAEGTPPITYQLQVSTDEGDNWANVPGATASPYETPADLSMDGWIYQVIATGPAGTVPATSGPATIQVSIALPQLSSPSALAISPTQATGTVVTAYSGGTLYWLATTSTPTGAEIRSAGQSQPVSTTGLQSVSVSGLFAGTPNYRIHFVWSDADGLDSVPARSNFFTTPTVSGIDGRLPLSRNDYFEQRIRIAVSQAA